MWREWRGVVFESLPSSWMVRRLVVVGSLIFFLCFCSLLLFVVGLPHLRPRPRLVPHIVHYGPSAPPGISSLTSVLLRCILASALLPFIHHPLVPWSPPPVTLSDIPQFVPINRHSSLITRHMTFDVPHEPLATGPPTLMAFI